MKTSLKRPASCPASSRQGCYLLSYPVRRGDPRKAKGRSPRNCRPLKRLPLNAGLKKRAGNIRASSTTCVRHQANKRARKRSPGRTRQTRSVRRDGNGCRKTDAQSRPSRNVPSTSPTRIHPPSRRFGAWIRVQFCVPIVTHSEGDRPCCSQALQLPL